MAITQYLENNARLYGDEVALVELNPEQEDTRKITWKEYSLIQPTEKKGYRREISWKVFDEKANRMANMLLARGVKKGEKVGILMMNCLEWLPIYFGILKSGAIAVPLNFAIRRTKSSTASSWRTWRCCCSGRSSSAASRT